MKKKHSVSVSVTKFKAVTASAISHVIDTIWTIGTSVTAEMVKSSFAH